MQLSIIISLIWLMFGHDPEHTGRTQVRFGDLNLKKVWTFSLPAHVYRYTRHTSVFSSQPVITTVDGKCRVFIGAYDQNLYCLDGETGREIWRFQTSGKINHSPLIQKQDKRQMLFLASSDRSFYALDAATGEKQWSFETRPWSYTTEEAVTSSPVGIRLFGKWVVYVGYWNADRKSLKPVQQGEVFAFDGQSGSLLWRKTLSKSYINSPAVTMVKNEYTLFVTAREGKLFALSAHDGAKVWQFTADGEIFSSPSLMEIAGETLVLFGTRFGSLYCLRAETGEIRWHYRAGHMIDGTPAVGVAAGQSIVIFGSYDRCIHAVNGENGEKIWKFPTGKYVTASAALAESRRGMVVFINSLDDHLYGLNGANGTLLWKFKSGKRLWDYETRGESLWSSPAVYAVGSKPYLLFPSYDGTLYAFSE
ncbi:PQQ-binding-like beta-propeller repeat protein [candidate division KSB1 bacterium]|nr:PQQ-binding-like beta-propeller repeat protein [candidate division KSB1 bacterium]